MKNCYYHSGQEPSGKQRPCRSKEKPQEPPVPTPPPRGERGDRVGLRGRKQLFRWHWCKVSSHRVAELPDHGTNSKKDAQSPVSPSEEAASGVGKRTHTCFIALSARYLTNPSLESRTCRRATASSTCSVTQRLSHRRTSDHTNQEAATHVRNCSNLKIEVGGYVEARAPVARGRNSLRSDRIVDYSR